MSPHILIDTALDGLEDADCPPHNEVLVMKQITDHLVCEAITPDEFKHYCKRLYAALDRRPRRAA